MFTNKKREGINRFVCDDSLCVAETPKASIKYHKPLLPIIPFGIVAYGFVGQPFPKQLYTKDLLSVLSRYYAISLRYHTGDQVTVFPSQLASRSAMLVVVILL